MTEPNDLHIGLTQDVTPGLEQVNRALAQTADLTAEFAARVRAAFASLNEGSLEGMTGPVDRAISRFQALVTVMDRVAAAQTRIVNAGQVPDRPLVQELRQAAREQAPKAIEAVTGSAFATPASVRDVSLTQLRREVGSLFDEFGGRLIRLNAQAFKGAHADNPDVAGLTGSTGGIRAGSIVPPSTFAGEDEQSIREARSARQIEARARRDAAAAEDADASATRESTSATREQAASTRRRTAQQDATPPAGAAGAGGGAGGDDGGRKPPPGGPSPTPEPEPEPRRSGPTLGPSATEKSVQAMLDAEAKFVSDLREGTAFKIGAFGYRPNPSPEDLPGSKVFNARTFEPAGLLDSYQTIKAFGDQLARSTNRDEALQQDVAKSLQAVVEQARVQAQQQNYQQLTSREAAGDTTVTRTPTGRNVIDTSGPTPTVSRVVQDASGDRLVPATEEEARRILEAAGRLRAAEEQIAEERARQVALQARRDAGDITLQSHGRETVDRSNPAAPVVTRTIPDPLGDRAVIQSGTLAAESMKRVTQALDRETAARERNGRRLDAEADRLSNKGVVGSFLGGLSQGSFAGRGQGFDFEGLARAAGQTVKYSALYQTVGLLEQALGSVATAFLDADNSITELNVAMRDGNDVTGDFVNSLTRIAAIGGFNVGEAMDVAASGIRAFRDQVGSGQDDVNALGTAFATQASRMAVLTNTTLADAAGNLKAITSGFGLSPTTGGFGAINDAIAGAKLLGGGDEKQIGQGLANSALTFRQLGFSLRESATLLSTINAQTDQGGTLIASRVSRLGSIIQGTTGRGFIAQLNQQLPANEFVDTKATVRDQILQLANAYKTLGTAQRQQLVSALGGTAQTRELIILLEQINKITDEASGAKGAANFDNKAAEEFEKRLKNVSAELTQIKGNITGILTNVTISGVAAPLEGLVTALQGATAFARDLSGAMNLIPKQALAIASSVVAVAAALTLVAKIRAAEGVGGFVRQLEHKFQPAQALARQQLADQAIADGKVGGRTDIAGGAFAGNVFRSSAALETRGAQLSAAQAELDSLRTAHAAERSNTDEASRQAVITRQAEEVAAKQAEIARLEAQVGVLADVQARDVRRAKVATRILGPLDREAADLASAHNVTLQGLHTEELAATRAGDTEAVKRVQARRLQVEQDFATRIAQIEAERLAAEGRITALADPATRTGRARASLRDAFAVPYAAARDEGSGRLAAGAKAGGAVAKGAAGAIGAGLLDAAGGPVGLAIGAVTIAAGVGAELKAFHEQLADLNKNDEKLHAAATDADPRTYTVAEAKDRSAAFAAAASAYKEAAGQMFGLADFLAGGIAKTRQQQDELDAAFATAEAEAAATAGKNDAARRSKSGEDLTGLIDTTTPASIDQSVSDLQAAGRGPDYIRKVLQASITATPGTTDNLSETQRVAVQQSGLEAALQASRAATLTAGAGATRPIPVPFYGGKGIGATGRVSEAEATAPRPANVSIEQQKQVGETVNQIIADELAAKVNLNTDAGQKDLETKLKPALEKILPGVDVTSIISAAGAAVRKNVTQLVAVNDGITSIVKESSLAVAQLAETAQGAGQANKLTSLTTGSRDRSTLAQSQVYYQGLVSIRADTVAKYRRLGLTDKQINEALEKSDLELQNAKVKYLSDLQADAQASTAVLEAQRKQAITAANASPAAVANINAGYDRIEFGSALSNKDTASLITLINRSDAATVKGFETVLKKKIADQAGKVAGLKEAAGGGYGNTDPGEINRQQRILDDLNGQLGALQLAETQAGPQFTKDQIAASREAIAAATTGNKVDIDQAGLDKAIADLNAYRATNANDTVGINEKLAAIAQLRLQLLTDTATQAIDFAHAFDSPDDPIQAATKALDTATAALKTRHTVGGNDTLERAALAAAQAQLQLAKDQAASIHAQAGIDLTDPVKVANQALIDARRRQRDINADPRSTQFDRDQAKIATTNAANDAEAKAFQQRLSDAQIADQLGRTSHAAYLNYLQGEHNRLTSIHNKTRQQIDELNTIDQAIKAAANQLSGQFNIGDIKVPTIYEVRRAVKNSLAPVEQGVYAAGATNNTTIHINGADLTAVDAIMRKYIGSSNRFTNATRKS